MPKNDGSGCYYRGGKKIDITWGEKISKSLKEKTEYEKTETLLCPQCNNAFRSYKGMKAYCSKKCKHESLKEDRLSHRTWSLGANVKLGKGKKEFMRKMLVKATGKPCPYCKKILDLEDCSLDHKIPIGKAKYRRKKIKYATELAKVDTRENLHIVCKECNQLKGKIPHKKYLKLIAFLDKDEELKALVFDRFKKSIGLFMRHKKGK